MMKGKVNREKKREGKSEENKGKREENGIRTGPSCSVNPSRPRAQLKDSAQKAASGESWNSAARPKFVDFMASLRSCKC